MSKRRWVQIGGELVEVSADYVPEPRSVPGSALWNDRAYQDMGDPRFKSRTEHREFMRQHGYATADDFKETWRENEKRRIAVRQGVDPTRRATLEKVIHQLANKR